MSYEGARIMATKLTGDPNVPAGQTTFWAGSTPLPHPWPQVRARTSFNAFISCPASVNRCSAAALVMPCGPCGCCPALFLPHQPNGTPTVRRLGLSVGSLRMRARPRLLWPCATPRRVQHVHAP